MLYADLTTMVGSEPTFTAKMGVKSDGIRLVFTK